VPCDVYSVAKKFETHALICRVSERLLQRFLINVQRIPLYNLNENLFNPLIRLVADSCFNQIDLESLIFRSLDVVGGSQILWPNSSLSSIYAFNHQSIEDIAKSPFCIWNKLWELHTGYSCSSLQMDKIKLSLHSAISSGLNLLETVVSLV